MYIGNVEIKNNVFMAPMAGVTDKPYRTICMEMGCGLVYSEMVSAKGLFYNSANTEKLMDCDEGCRPYAVQLFGSEPEIMGKMAKRIEDMPFDIIDVNMGCPAPKIVKNGDGSALMQSPELVEEIVSAIVSSQKKPVTVKIRKGYDDDNINAVEIALAAQRGGASAVTVHGRTRPQFYSGKADWEIIKDVKSALNIPVIGNGDIVSPETARAMLDSTGCDAVMIGRAAEGNPWIFERVTHFINTGELLPEPSRSQKAQTVIRHARMLIDFKGEYIGVREMRRHLGYYTKGLPQASAMRAEINTVMNMEDIKILVDRYFLGI
ncbi:tRNA dihydrouridine synthase DusB [Lachnospiraceae bacterium NSJ-143]|nr:tRNA dihydrouridine synthase DusB [Lachnospiraceae bacterium NSJ-143]